MQASPSPLYPSIQVHLKLSGKSSHLANWLHPPLFTAHSSTSVSQIIQLIVARVPKESYLGWKVREFPYRVSLTDVRYFVVLYYCAFVPYIKTWIWFQKSRNNLLWFLTSYTLFTLADRIGATMSPTFYNDIQDVGYIVGDTLPTKIFVSDIVANVLFVCDNVLMPSCRSDFGRTNLPDKTFRSTHKRQPTSADIKRLIEQAATADKFGQWEQRKMIIKCNIQLFDDRIMHGVAWCGQDLQPQCQP